MFSLKKDGHYDAAQWVDFVRGLGNNAERDAMQAHLQTGCSNCRETAGLFANVALRASAEASYDVPEYAVHCARGIHVLQRPEEVRLLPRTLAKLVYDSFHESLLAGVRSQRGGAHQLMYTAGPYCVDLRLERERGATHVALIGQVANRERDAVGVPDVPIFLFSRNALIARAITNQFGEFAMEFRPTNSLRLYASVPGEGRGIEVRLGRAPAAGEDADQADSQP